MNEKERELGVQPLDSIMKEKGLTHHDLVAVSTEGLTHKQVSKGSKGRRLTRNIKEKIANALSSATAEQSFQTTDLFTYR